jgi:hypothetical protein
MDNKKILLFTTIGKIEGENILFTEASFSSWKKQNLDVVVFGEPSHENICKHYGFTLDLNYEKNEFGLPIVRDLFLSSQRYKGYDIYCYTNADIIFNSNLLDSLNAISFPNFLAVGQRINIFNLPHINYISENQESIDIKISKCKLELHNPGGIDYFAFTPNFWDLSIMPDFSIARGRFDHWLMGYALTKGNGPVIDITKTFKVYQPEPIEREVGNGDAVESYNNGDYKLGYQLLKNRLFYFKDNLHGQTNMSPFYLDNQNKDIILCDRKDEDIPLNEFKIKILYKK